MTLNMTLIMPVVTENDCENDCDNDCDNECNIGLLKLSQWLIQGNIDYFIIDKHMCITMT